MKLEIKPKIKLVLCPRPEDDKHWFERDIPLEFRECDACAAKPGCPTLCNGCLANRAVIGRLQKKIEELEHL